MPPEQRRKQPLDRRADIYASGVGLFEALTGRRYIEAEEHAAMVLEIVSKQPVAPSTYRSDVPHGLDAITMKALAPDPNERFTTAEEMALALEDAVGLASPARVGRWVTEIAAASLSERAERVKEVESSASGTFLEPEDAPSLTHEHPASERIGPPSAPGLPVASTFGEPPRSVPFEGTSPTNVGATLNAAPPSERIHPLWYAVAGGGLLAVMMVATLLVVTQRSRAPSTTAGHATPSVRPSVAAAAPPPPSTETPGAPPPPSAPPAPTEDIDEIDDAGTPASGTSTPPHHPPAARPPRVLAPAPRPSASTPEDLFRRRR
jgi:serine/threonine protein kinase